MEIYNTDSFDFLDKKTRKILLESREAFIPHTPYLYEKKMLEAVRMGDVHLAVERLHLMEHTGKAGTLSKNPLRQAQILMISFITQITRAAMDAGVPENLAYAMSDSYIQTSGFFQCSKASKTFSALFPRSAKGHQLYPKPSSGKNHLKGPGCCFRAECLPFLPSFS